jgi:hypothetical protein
LGLALGNSMSTWSFKFDSTDALEFEMEGLDPVRGAW